MQNVILVIHILACLAIIGLVLVQKSEGGGLGVGGGGANSLMSGRGAAGAIVRTTIIIGGIFFATSLALTSIANRSRDKASGIEKALEETSPATTPTQPEDLFDPSVTLLENETAPATMPETAGPVDPTAGVAVPPASALPPADVGQPVETEVVPDQAAPATNPQ